MHPIVGACAGKAPSPAARDSRGLLPPSRRPDAPLSARLRTASRALRVAARWPPATLDPATPACWPAPLWVRWLSLVFLVPNAGGYDPSPDRVRTCVDLDSAAGEESARPSDGPSQQRPAGGSSAPAAWRSPWPSGCWIGMGTLPASSPSPLPSSWLASSHHRPLPSWAGTLSARLAHRHTGLAPGSWTRGVFDYAASGRVAVRVFS